MSSKKEIIKQKAKELFMSSNYVDFNIKVLSQDLPFARSSVYTYYKIIDDILLDVYIDELEIMKDEINNYKPNNKTDLIAHIVSTTLNHKVLLKITNILFTVIESNVTVESLAGFKSNLARVTREIDFHYFSCLDIQEEEIGYLFNFIFLHSAMQYAASTRTEKQKQAMIKGGYQDLPGTLEERLTKTISHYIDGLLK